jgi:hypothetical protein
MSRTRCHVCKALLFSGNHDPWDHYVRGLGGWPNDLPPIVVCFRSWRSLWRRLWYHQACCGVYFDTVNAAGHWFVFGFTPTPESQASIPSAVFRTAVPVDPHGQKPGR